MTVLKKGYEKVLPPFVGEAQSKRSNCEAKTRQLAEQNTKTEEMKLEARRLVDDTGQVGEMQPGQDVKRRRLIQQGGSWRQRSLLSKRLVSTVAWDYS